MHDFRPCPTSRGFQPETERVPRAGPKLEAPLVRSSIRPGWATFTFLFVTLLLGSCAASDANDSGAGVGDGGTRVDTGVADAAAGLDAVIAGPPGTPTLLSVQLVTHGTFQLAWDLPASGCATLELNRNVDGGAFGVATTLTGVATEATDEPGHNSGTYCYTVTCKLNGESSPPSNEKCATQ
ncbi:MAG: hypothetical protein HY791_34255 [Deltaproteobacteria bacterium]|nr:hypothetical protein [Deltaproteobacteria bacterium]